MGDEQVGEAVPALQVDQQIDDLGLDRYIERRYRLVAHDEIGPERKGARDADALALAAGELVRIVAHLVRPQPDLLEQFRDALPIGLAGHDAGERAAVRRRCLRRSCAD